MSTWMSIGFDPDQMDPATEPVCAGLHERGRG